MFTLEQILNKARAEIGVKETGENYVKYNDAYWGKGVGGSDYPWCVVFLWWVFQNTGVAFPTTAHCNGVRSFAQSFGRWVTGDYQKGDLVIFDYDGDNSGDHIGIVESVGGAGRLITIEGNYSDSVARVTRTIAQIIGAYRPTYGSCSENSNNSDGGDEIATPVCALARNDSVGVYSAPTQTMSVELPLLRKGHKGEAVKVLQMLLDTDADGFFGTNTDKLVKAFQSECGLEADGEVGTWTWGALFGGR